MIPNISQSQPDLNIRVITYDNYTFNKVENIKKRIKLENRENKINYFIEDKEFKEKTLEEDKEYIDHIEDISYLLSGRIKKIPKPSEEIATFIKEAFKNI